MTTLPANQQLSHFYQNIDGWFDFDDLYSEMVRSARDGARFVEIGAWLGRSTAFMAVEIANSRKAIDFVVIDTWQGSADESYHQQVVAQHGGSIHGRFMENMRAGGVAGYIRTLVMSSQRALGEFPDDSLDFVFIDAAHDFESVRADIAMWRRKVRPGGMLAGHDIEWQGLRQAVQDALPWTEVGERRSSWYWIKGGAVRGHWIKEQSTQSSISPAHLLFIPCAACPDRLQRALRSLQGVAANIVVIDSSSGGLGIDRMAEAGNVGIFRMNAKYSFTQVQNWAQDQARLRSAEWLLFMHADAACCDQDVVSDLLRYADDAARRERVGVVFTKYDALCAFNMRAVEDVGPWDETFEWYVSDCDYYHRIRRRGWSMLQWPGAQRVFHEGSASIKHDAGLASEERRLDQYHHDHYRHKWGGPPGQERHPIPYNGRA